MWRRYFGRLWRRFPGWAQRAFIWCFNAHFLVGAVAVIRDGDGQVLLAHHTYRERGPWALPGGWVQRGENPADTIVREILEETGLRVEITSPLTVQVGRASHLTVVYAARLVGGTFRPSAEVSEVRFVSLGAWPEGMRESHRILVETMAHHPAFHYRAAP